MQQQLLGMANSAQQSQQMLDQMTALATTASPHYKPNWTTKTSLMAAIMEATTVAALTTTVVDATAVVAAVVELDALSNTVGRMETAHTADPIVNPLPTATSKMPSRPACRAAAPPAVTGYLLDDGGQY
jgi:phage shock protein A